jgi:phospholipid/cholesterol/gamma-HCH transport system ATP-binding protein
VSAEDAPAGADLIEFRDVSIQFRRQKVLRGLNLTIRRGETLCVIGESGCGKTVLLKLIVGLLQPTSGKIYFEGEDVTRMDAKALVKLRLRFGFLFQMAALFDSLDVYDNVAFGLREHAVCGEDQVAKIVAERLQDVGLPAGLEHKKPAELSGGQRKRVGLARALALDPEVMLYDEPTTGLDPIMTDVVNELILQTQRGGHKTGIVVTHEMRTVTKVADRVVMFFPLARVGRGESQVIYDGPPGGLEDAEDRRVRQFVRGEAGDRLRELAAQARAAGSP